MVSRSAALWHRSALWFRPRFRAHADVYHRGFKHPRRYPVRPYARERRILIGWLRLDRRSRVQNDQRRRFDRDLDFVRRLLVLLLISPKFVVQMNRGPFPNDP